MIYFKYFQDTNSSNGRRMYPFTISGLKVPSHTEVLIFSFMHLGASPVNIKFNKNLSTQLFMFCF